MKIALVHELLTMKGGAERVLKIFADLFPEAPIYTLLYDEQKLVDWFPPERVRPSRLQRFAGFSTNHHLYLSKFPRAIEAWDFSEFDLVLSSSSAFAHNIITNGAPRHVSFIHSPARYLWDRTHDVLERAGRGPLGLIRRAYLSHVFHKLRLWDAESAARADVLLAASKEVQRRIELYWRRDSDVVHPPVDDVWLQTRDTRRETQDYFLIVSTLASYKRIDIAIEACNKLQVPLKIAGSGSAERQLQQLAGPTATFLGHQDESQLRDLYSSARAVIFPGDEDFGIVPLEAQACGTPVIAYRSGGALETIIDGTTGIFFDEPTAVSLAESITHFNPEHFDPEECRKQAKMFSKKEFERKILRQVNELL